MILFLKYILLFLLFLNLSSCQFVENKIPDKKALLDKELKSINWNDVDEYPSVADCEIIESKAQRKQCFFEFLSAQIQEKINVDTLSVLYPELDTIQVKVTIFADSKLKFEPQFLQDSLTFDRIKIDSVLQTKLVNFPKINPALKRGIPVKTEFILPVIIKFSKK